MTTLLDLEAETEASLRYKALTRNDFPFHINDTRETLLFNYLQTLLPLFLDEDMQLLEDPVFELLYLSPRSECERILAEKGIYPDESVNRVILIVLINYINNDCEKSFAFFGRHASPDAFCCLLGWDEMTYDKVSDFYFSYEGERSDGLMLTLEAYGYESVLEQRLTDDLIYSIFQLCLIPERLALRSTCAKLALHKSAPHSYWDGYPRVDVFSDTLSDTFYTDVGMQRHFAPELAHPTAAYSFTVISENKRLPELVRQLILSPNPGAGHVLWLILKSNAERFGLDENGEYTIQETKHLRVYTIRLNLRRIHTHLLHAEGLLPLATLRKCFEVIDPIVRTLGYR